LIGNIYMTFDPFNPTRMSRLAYFYLPGQRRVRLAPEINFDTPSPEAAGNMIMDEIYMFNGSMEKYNWKLVGKKEMYIPYNDYKAEFWVPPDQLIGPHYFNPDHVRWELHRVWIVEATLNKGDRHVLPKRRFYVDEDSWSAHAAEAYDSQGTMVKANFLIFIQAYDKHAGYLDSTWDVNLLSGTVHTSYLLGPTGWLKFPPVRPASFWTPEAVAAGSLR
jgi:hypothetical protein